MNVVEEQKDVTLEECLASMPITSVVQRVRRTLKNLGYYFTKVRWADEYFIGSDYPRRSLELKVNVDDLVAFTAKLETTYAAHIDEWHRKRDAEIAEGKKRNPDYLPTFCSMVPVVDFEAIITEAFEQSKGKARPRCPHCGR